MNLIINYPKDKTTLEDNMAYISAILMKKCIDDLNINIDKKKEVEKTLLEELKKS